MSFTCTTDLATVLARLPQPPPLFHLTSDIFFLEPGDHPWHPKDVPKEYWCGDLMGRMAFDDGVRTWSEFTDWESIFSYEVCHGELLPRKSLLLSHYFERVESLMDFVQLATSAQNWDEVFERILHALPRQREVPMIAVTTDQLGKLIPSRTKREIPNVGKPKN